MTNTFRSGTVLGIVSILIWSTNVAVSRSLTESLGVITSGALLFLCGGTVATGLQIIIQRGAFRISMIPGRFLAVCGGLFIVYQVSLYLCLGLSADREQALVAALINYLWVPLTLVFSLFVLKKKAGPLLIPGLLLAWTGVVWAMFGSSGMSVWSLGPVLRAGAVPYALALLCSITWALYSNYARLLSRPGQPNAVPLFILATGVVLMLLRLVIHESSAWTFRTGLESVYAAFFPVVTAYMLWDAAMRTGNMVLVATLSYLIPLIATIAGSLYLGVPMGAGLWGGCLLVIAGAAVCRVSVKD